MHNLAVWGWLLYSLHYADYYHRSFLGIRNIHVKCGGWWPQRVLTARPSLHLPESHKEPPSDLRVTP